MSLLHGCWQKLIIETELLPGSLCQVLVAGKSDDDCRIVCEKLLFFFSVDKAIIKMLYALLSQY